MNNLNLPPLRTISTSLLCLLLFLQGINLFRGIEANNWLNALIAVTAAAAIGGYLVRRQTTIDK